ncbi:hypothetical protein IJI31_04045 [bacterium]|nr:hypothetical protein [bacterium]
MNKLQIKAEILTLITKLMNVTNLPDSEFNNLLNCNDQDAVMKILLKELSRATEQKAFVICYMLTRIFPNDVLENSLWEFIKDKSISDYAKMVAFNLLKDLGNKVKYEDVGQYFDEFDAIIDEDTIRLLKSAIINPEAQIDFMDFLFSVPENDRMALINSLANDYSDDALANILIPVFLNKPESNEGKRALEILGETKSVLAFHALDLAKDFVPQHLKSAVNKSLSSLKISGIRVDSTDEFYKDILSVSKPYKSYVSYPDGHGNIAVVFSRLRNDETLQFVAMVLNNRFGVMDCFGFNELLISDFERIVARFFENTNYLEISENYVKYLVNLAEKISRKNNDEVSYEFICWKTLLSDIEEKELRFEIERKELSQSEVDSLCLSDIAQHWFIDVRTNDAFNLFINKLNHDLREYNFDLDFDKFIAKNYDDIYGEEDIKAWKEIFELSAYLKVLENKNDEAQQLYSLRDNYQFLTNIIRKSIYEHYVSERYKIAEEKNTTNIFRKRNNDSKMEFELMELDLIISTIEAKWVQNV